MYKLKKKASLFYRYNRLTSIPKSLANCVIMEEFNVEGNNIGQLPVRIHYTLLTFYTVYTIHCVHFTLNLCRAWTVYRY